MGRSVSRKTLSTTAHCSASPFMTEISEVLQLSLVLNAEIPQDNSVTVEVCNKLVFNGTVSIAGAMIINAKVVLKEGNLSFHYANRT